MVFSCRAVENSRRGASSQVSTAWTPGTASAALVSIDEDPGVRVRRAQQLDVQQALDRDVEGVARRAAYDAAGRPAPGMLRPNGAAGRVVLDVASRRGCASSIAR